MATQPATPFVIQTQDLTKAYKRGTTALEGLNLQVKQGEIFGYLGPNGAGKTTTIRLMLDLIRPTRGSILLFGLDAQKNSVELHRRIGFLPGELSLWQNQTALQVIRYLWSVHGDLDMGYVNQLAERLKLDMTKTIRSYSSGNRRKIGLVIALMHKPDLLILDEPTNGLDPLMQQTFHEMVKEASNEGRTVFLSSHILSEVQAICERVAILGEGKLKAVERVADLTRVNFYRVTVSFNQPINAADWEGIPGVSDVKARGNELELKLSGDFDPLLRKLNGYYVTSIKTSEPSLEEIFLSFYNGQAMAGTEAQQPVEEVAR